MPGSHIKVNQLMTCDDSLQALEKYNVEKDIAAFIKKEFDKKYNPTWHCIVGRNFGECALLPMPGFLPELLELSVQVLVACRLICNARDQALHLFLSR